MTGFKTAYDALLHTIRLIFLLPLYVYKWCISPLMPHTCRYYPSCSNYMLIAIKEWGIFKGFLLGIKRICRCRPGKPGGIDYVPLNIKGERKWTY